MQPKNLTEEDVKALTTYRSFVEANVLFGSGFVRMIESSINTVTVTVGGFDPYMVTITKDRHVTKSDCTCEYKGGGYCPHITATLMYLLKDDLNKKIISNTIMEQVKNVENEKDDLASILNIQVGQEKYLDVSADEDGDKSGTDEGNNISETPIPDTSKKSGMINNLDETVKLVDSQYRDAVGTDGMIAPKDNVNFEKINNTIQHYEHAGRHEEAIKMSLKVAEYVSGKMNIVSDVKHHYTRQVEFMIRKIAANARKSRISARKKRQYVSQILNSYLQEENKLFALSYMDALYRICNTQEETLWAISLIDKHLKSKDSMQRKISDVLEAEIPLLENLGHDELKEFLSLNHKKSETLWARQIWNLIDHDPKKAVKSATHAVKAYPDSPYLSDILHHTMNIAGDAKQSDVLRTLFVSTWNWIYYEKLRAESTDWDADLAHILDDIRKSDNPHMCIDVLLYEGKDDQAVREAMSSNDLSVLDAYKYEFFARYPKECYAQYAKIMPELVKDAKAREDYQTIQRHAESLITIPKHKKRAKMLLESLKYDITSGQAL